MSWAIKSERRAHSDQKKVAFREFLNYQNTKCRILVIWMKETKDWERGKKKRN
jgi:hypothetical protein